MRYTIEVLQAFTSLIVQIKRTTDITQLVSNLTVYIPHSSDKTKTMGLRDSLFIEFTSLIVQIKQN